MLFCFLRPPVSCGWCEAHQISPTLVVDQYIHLVPLHDTDTRICSSKINPNNGLAWLHNSGGSGRWDCGEGTNQDKKEQKNADPQGQLSSSVNFSRHDVYLMLSRPSRVVCVFVLSELCGVCLGYQVNNGENGRWLSVRGQVVPERKQCSIY